MKKFLTMVMMVLFIFAMCGCKNDVVGEQKIYLPFSVDQVEYIEMFHYLDDISSAEKKVVTEIENIQYLHGIFEHLPVETLHEKPKDAANAVTAFRFHLVNNVKEHFEVIYYGYGVKDGVLKMPPNEIYYFTSADIGWNWSELDIELETVSASENELPQ